MTRLLDVNVLIALIDQWHARHQSAHQWFQSVSSEPWATCPFTENGLARIISSPGYPSPMQSVHEAGELLRLFCQDTNNVFWPDELSILDTTIFDLTKLTGHKQITDLYLAGLDRHHGGKLATFDQSIPVAALVKPSSDVLEVIPSS